MIRVVFDTSVLYSAILKPKGVPAAVLDFVGSGLLIPCVSPAVLAEYRDVLLDRPALRPYAQQAQHVLDILTSVAVEVTPIQPLKIFICWFRPISTPYEVRERGSRIRLNIVTLDFPR